MSYKLEMKRVFKTSPLNLYEDFTDAEKMEHWFFEGEYWTAQVKANVEVGGDYEVEMVTDIGNSFTHDGVFTTVRPGTCLEMTWGSGIVEDTKVTLNFVPTSNGCELQVIHDNFQTDEMRERHRQIWNHCLDHLEEYVNNPTPFALYDDPEYGNSAA